MQRLDGSQGAGVGLPVQVVEGKSREQPWGKKFVDIVRVEIVDWMARVSIKIMDRTATAPAIMSRGRGETGVGVLFYLSPSRSRRVVPC